MLNKFRIGNDIRVVWSLYDAIGDDVSLMDRDILIELHVGSHIIPVEEFDITDNILSFTYAGADQRFTGTYSICLKENSGRPSMISIDEFKIFVLVDHTWQSDNELSTDFEVSFKSVLTGVLGPTQGIPGQSAGFGSITGEVLSDGGDEPEIEVETDGPDTAKNIHFKFKNMEWKGDDGADAGFGNITASVVPGEGVPSVAVTALGPDTRKDIHFAFSGLNSSGYNSSALLNSAPRLSRIRGIRRNSDLWFDQLIVKHPALGLPGYEAVLMVYSTRNGRKTNEYEDDNGNIVRSWKTKKCWSVAYGSHEIVGDDDPFTSSDGIINAEPLLTFIIKRFIEASDPIGSTISDGRQYSYENLDLETFCETGNTIEKLFTDCVFRSHVYKRFGIAIRYANPAFTARLDPAKELKNTTQQIGNTPRYIYSSVAMFGVHLQKSDDEVLYRNRIRIGLLDTP